MINYLVSYSRSLYWMGKMNVDMHRFLHLAVTTSLCDLSDGDRLELVGEWYQLECLLIDYFC